MPLTTILVIRARIQTIITCKINTYSKLRIWWLSSFSPPRSRHDVVLSHHFLPTTHTSSSLAVHNIVQHIRLGMLHICSAATALMFVSVCNLNIKQAKEKPYRRPSTSLAGVSYSEPGSSSRLFPLDVPRGHCTQGGNFRGR